MNPRARSVWMVPAAATAFSPTGRFQARTSSSPTVKKDCKPTRLYDSLDHPVECQFFDAKFLHKLFDFVRWKLADFHLQFALQGEDGGVFVVVVDG